LDDPIAVQVFHFLQAVMVLFHGDIRDGKKPG
jgi:hypothetical protein